MYEQPECSTSTKEKQKNSPKKLILLILASIFSLAIFLSSVFVGFCIYKYCIGMKMLHEKNYDEAIELFTEYDILPGSRQRITEAFYGKGTQLYDKQKYNEAIECFENAESYENSHEFILACYYGLGINAQNVSDHEKAIECFALSDGYEDSSDRIKKSYYFVGKHHLDYKEYETAIKYFKLADDFDDAKVYIDICNYSKGHDLFMEEKYTDADKYFDLAGDLPDNFYKPHFTTLNEAENYLWQSSGQLKESIDIYIGEMPEGYTDRTELMLLMYNYIPGRSVYVEYSTEKKLLSLRIKYYAGQRIAYAHRNEKTDILSETELSAYNKALALVEQAKNETSTDFELELWIHNWICDNTIYNSPLIPSNTMDTTDIYQLNCTGPLLHGEANCQGYSDAFYLLSSLAGFETRFVGSDDHVWNAIKINSNWYVVDTTYNDINLHTPISKYYVWFNAPFDTDEDHIPYGGTELFSWMTIDDYSVTYYSTYNCAFSDAEEAMEYMAKQNVIEGKTWTFVMIKDQEIPMDILFTMLENEIRKITYTNKSLFQYWKCVDGNTYYTIYWL